MNSWAAPAADCGDHLKLTKWAHGPHHKSAMWAKSPAQLDVSNRWVFPHLLFFLSNVLLMLQSANVYVAQTQAPLYKCIKVLKRDG